MNRNDVDPVSPKRLERGLQLIFLDREIAIDHGVVIGASKGGPRVDSDVIADVEFMHLRFVADAEFNHSVFGFALQAKDFVQRFGGNGTCFA